MKAMIFAAGLGTRLKPLTNSKPKALVDLGGKTFLENVIIKLKSFGISEIVINVHHFAGQIIEVLNKNNNFGVNIFISDEREQLLDTGGGLKKAAPLLSGNEPIIIYNVDVLSDIDLKKVIKFHVKEKALATIVARERKTQRYLMFDDSMQLTGWKNKSTGEKKISNLEKFEKSRPLAFSGIHVISPEIFNFIKQEGKFSIIDTYLVLAKTQKIMGYFDKSGYWMDIGKPEQLKEARKMIQSK